MISEYTESQNRSIKTYAPKSAIDLTTPSESRLMSRFFIEASVVPQHQGTTTTDKADFVSLRA
jgi:hypothetical protein